MALKDLTEYVSMVPAAAQSPSGNLWSSYDDEADVLYISFDRSVPSYRQRANRRRHHPALQRP